MKNKKLLKLAIKTAIKAGEETIKYYQDTQEIIVKDDNSPLTLADLEANRVINERLAVTEIEILSEENKIVSYDTRKNWKKFWLVDPLDGTKEFINKRSEYTVNIALIEDGIPIIGVVYAPILKVLYFGMKELGSYKYKIKNDSSTDHILENAKKMKVSPLPDTLRVVASRSHLSEDTQRFIEKLNDIMKADEMKSIGSSLKLCFVAEGEADIYPRLGPTMEWDTAASHAVAIYAGSKVIEATTGDTVRYNKENLLNPYFIVYHPKLDKAVNSILNLH